MGTSPAPAASANLIQFKRNLSLLGAGSALGIEVMADASGDVLDALRNNTPFPAREIDLASAAVRAEGGKDIRFDGGGGAVSFKASGGLFGGIGVFSKPSKVRATLKADEHLAEGLDLPADDAAHRYLMLRWGYDVKASARGSLALAGGASSVKFGVEAARDGLYAVIRRTPTIAGARTALQDVVDSWLPPRAVDSPARLDPGTWLVAEVEGSVGLSLGATFGYDFNWIREAELGGLSGDIGLRIQLGVSASLGFSASGKYCVVVSRESLDATEQVLRLRLFKLSYKGWNFALNAGATVEPVADVLPDSADDFIKGVFGTHGAQIVKDLQLIEKWTDPKTPLPDLLSELGVDYVKKLIGDLSGIDPETAFEAARAKVLGLFEAWDRLPHRASTMLFKLIEDRVDLTQIRAIVGQAAGADQDSLKRLISEHLTAIDFFRTPAGKMLESLAIGSLLGAVTNSKEFEAFQEAAQALQKILDPAGALLDVLTKLQKYVNEALNLERIRKALTETDFEKLDAMLKQKLSAFLGKQINFSDIDKVRKTIHLLLEKRDEFYGKAIKALKRKYEFEFAASYQRATTSTALVDVEFDFGPGAAPGLAALWGEALDGKLNRLLVQPRTDVKIRSAEMTHGVKRNTHVELSMPFYKATIDHINESLARQTVIEEEGGRLIVYELTAEDRVKTTSVLPWKKTQRDSRLTIGAFLPFETGSARLRVHQTDPMTYTYSFDQARTKMKRGEVAHQLKPLVEQYLGSSFGAGAAPFDTWITDLDKTIDGIEFNGSDNFGNTLIELDVTLPPKVPAAWLRAPAEKDAFAYMEMSRNIQRALRRLLPACYFQNPDHYIAAQPPACALLVYAAMPASTDVLLEGTRLTLNRDTKVYWKFDEEDPRHAMIFNSKTQAALVAAMKDIRELFKSLGKDSDADFYSESEMRSIQGRADAGRGEELLIELLRMEKIIIEQAQAAGRELARFRGAAASKPDEAVKALEEFGSKLTDAFNAKVGSVYGGGALRALGTMVFVEAARAFDPEIKNVRPNAMLQLTVTREAVAFPPEGFPKHAALKKDVEIVIEQRLVSVGSQSH